MNGEAASRRDTTVSERPVALVTGSGTGIGAAAAILLAGRGCNVVVNYSRSEGEARETAGRCDGEGAETLVIQADVSEDDACRRMVDQTVARWGRIDFLMNNAGITRFNDHGDLEGLTAQDFQDIYAVNVIGAYQMARAATPALRKAGRGAILNVSSIAGVCGIGSSVAYAASKGALNAMTLSLARALAPDIRVNAICPGFVTSRWHSDGLGQKVFEKMRGHVEQTTPLAHACSPEEIAEVAVRMLCDMPFVTGETLLVDSGHHLTV